MNLKMVFQDEQIDEFEVTEEKQLKIPQKQMAIVKKNPRCLPNR
jgi:hypothetical protein